MLFLCLRLHCSVLFWSLMRLGLPPLAPLPFNAATLQVGLCMSPRVEYASFVSLAADFFLAGARCLSAGHHLRLTRGPAGNRTTTGSLPASPRTTPYQLSRGDTLMSSAAESSRSRTESVHLLKRFTMRKRVEEFPLCHSRRLRKMRKMMSLNCSICLMPIFGAGKPSM